MDWESALKIVLTAIASVGGASVIIIFAGRWLADLSAKTIIAKTEFEFEKKLEDLRSKLEKRNYISKVRFDLEIETYRQLSEAVFSMVSDTSFLFPHGIGWSHPDEEAELKRKEDNYNKAIESYNNATQSIMKNAPFVPKNIYQLFSEIRDDCQLQIQWFPDFKLNKLSVEVLRELSDVKRECLARTKKNRRQVSLFIGDT